MGLPLIMRPRRLEDSLHAAVALLQLMGWFRHSAHVKCSLGPGSGICMRSVNLMFKIEKDVMCMWDPVPYATRLEGCDTCVHVMRAIPEPLCNPLVMCTVFNQGIFFTEYSTGIHTPQILALDEKKNATETSTPLYTEYMLITTCSLRSTTDYPVPQAQIRNTWGHHQ